MNRTITATHSHVRYIHPALARHQNVVIDVPTLTDEFGIARQVRDAGFRSAGFETDFVPAIYTPVFTPPRQRVRMHREAIAALFGGIMAVCLIIFSIWLMITHKRGSVSSAPKGGIRHELRLFDGSAVKEPSR